MPTIIRATDRNQSTHGVAFNFDDMAVKADAYLGKVRIEAGKIVAQAKREAEVIRKQAEQKGRQTAAQTAAQAVDQAVRQQLATVLPALQKAVEEIRHARQAWLTHWETGAVHVASAIAGRLVRRELAEHPEIPLTLIREALELAAGSSRLRIRLNPADHEAIREQLDVVINELASLATTEIVPDPAITPGGCRVETNFGIIDQQFETQLARIEEELQQ